MKAPVLLALGLTITAALPAAVGANAHVSAIGRFSLPNPSTAGSQVEPNGRWGRVGPNPRQWRARPKSTSVERPAESGASADVGFRVSGLKPDRWGATTKYGNAQLQSRYQAIASVTCLGIRMPEYPVSSSTWVAGRVRYWDKLWCAGKLRQGKPFRLVYDAKSKTEWTIYRLINTTVSELTSGQSTSPSTRVGDALVRVAYDLAAATGRDSESTPTHRSLRYSVRDCGLASPALARCTLFVLYEEDVYDTQFNPGHIRFWVRLFTFARLLSLDPVAWDTRTEGSFYSTPYQLVCSDRNDLADFVVDYDPLTGKPAPTCR